eukprot:240341-Chlamydomonas_euryale.AAC.13
MPVHSVPCHAASCHAMQCAEIVSSWALLHQLGGMCVERAAWLPASIHVHVCMPSRRRATAGPAPSAAALDKLDADLHAKIEGFEGQRLDCFLLIQGHLPGSQGAGKRNCAQTPSDGAAGAGWTGHGRGEVRSVSDSQRRRCVPVVDSWLWPCRSPAAAYMSPAAALACSPHHAARMPTWIL